MRNTDWIVNYLVERAANTPSAGESVGDSDIAGVSRDQGIFQNVVVKNPKGKGFVSANSGFGFGMAVDPVMMTQINDFMRDNVADEDKYRKNELTGEEEERFSDTDEPELPNWQEVNRAIGNFVRNRANKSLEGMGLGKIAKNPISRYDGLDMSKTGIIPDFKVKKPKIKYRTY